MTTKVEARSIRRLAGMEDALLLRVAMDSGSGGGHSPLFKNGRFEYIPIPENKQSIESRRYETIPARWGGTLADYASHLAGDRPHFDPEFATYTYGDPNPKKRAQLRQLEEGDLLVFYAGLEDQEIGEARLYAIGFFTLDRTFDLEPMSEEERAEVLQRFPRNAHVKREEVTPESPRSGSHYPVIVKGKPEQSGLFDWPRPLAGRDQKTLRSFEKLTGFSGSLTRAGAARTTDNDDHSAIRLWLEKGAAALTDDESSLFSYVVATDSGFAPNPRHGYCTLATCKPKIRSAANVGDWVLGTAPVSTGEEEMVFLAQVDEKLTFNEYYRDERFEAKRPENDPSGDNIYYREDSNLVQVDDPPAHDSDDDRDHDTQTDAVLIGSLFWYFGGDGYEIPSRLRDELIHAYDSGGGAGHSREESLDEFSELLDMLQRRYRPGRHGKPRDGSRSESNVPDC